MNYQDWEQSVPQEIAGDRLWKMQVYRLALFAADLSWSDVSKLVKDRRTVRLSDQLFRAVGSIGANIAEGYSRGQGGLAGMGQSPGQRGFPPDQPPDP